ncbi:MAG: MarR family transcriptional regulator [Acidobacteriota bacterium]|nr:MAG: MarR family transcriptional regulator [Acidobacteriota bacterium]
MSVALQNELKQNKPFANEAEAAHLAVLVTAEKLKANSAQVFKAKDLTAAQYNALRILRGAGKAGITCTEISSRMITRDSDITRMLDRLEARGLISRERQADDRRVVKAFISKEGLQLLKDLDSPLRKFIENQMAGLSENDLKKLVKLLDKIRGNISE